MDLYKFDYMEKQQIISKTEKYIREVFEKDCTGHDWWHIFRVRKLALKIAENENADLFVVEMAALLHDLDDWKLSNNTNGKPEKTIEWLTQFDMPANETDHIIEIINEVSFKGAGVETVAGSIESKVVQDADRLDAIGAIGVARTFAYGGHKNRLIYHPGIKPEMHKSFEDYKKTTAPTINHFYEKLLLLKDRINTDTAMKMAEKRHRFMLNFLNQFYEEWECNS